jgi:hypothetical protein
LLEVTPDDVPASGVITTLINISRMSKDRLKFGHIPVGSILRDLVTVQNTTKDKLVAFSWDLTYDPMVESTVTIEPVTGILAPGESRVCRVTFTPDRQARVYELDIQCHFYDENEMVCFEVTVVLTLRANTVRSWNRWNARAVNATCQRLISTFPRCFVNRP